MSKADEFIIGRNGIGMLWRDKKGIRRAKWFEIDERTLPKLLYSILKVLVRTIQKKSNLDLKCHTHNTMDGHIHAITFYNKHYGSKYINIEKGENHV